MVFCRIFAFKVEVAGSSEGRALWGAWPYPTLGFIHCDPFFRSLPQPACPLPRTSCIHASGGVAAPFVGVCVVSIARTLSDLCLFHPLPVSSRPCAHWVAVKCVAWTSQVLYLGVCFLRCVPLCQPACSVCGLDLLVYLLCTVMCSAGVPVPVCLVGS